MILLAILAVLSHYLVPKNNLSKDGMEDVSANSIMAEKENTIDILVDGPFVEEEKDLSLKLRGSRNQRIWVRKNNRWEIEND